MSSSTCGYSGCRNRTSNGDRCYLHVSVSAIPSKDVTANRLGLEAIINKSLVREGMRAGSTPPRYVEGLGTVHTCDKTGRGYIETKDGNRVDIDDDGNLMQDPDEVDRKQRRFDEFGNIPFDDERSVPHLGDKNYWAAHIASHLGDADSRARYIAPAQGDPVRLAEDGLPSKDIGKFKRADFPIKKPKRKFMSLFRRG